MTPDEDVYYRGLGRALIEKASSADSAVAAPTSQFDEQAPLEKIERLDAEQTARLSRDDCSTPPAPSWRVVAASIRSTPITPPAWLYSTSDGRP
jgi:hypothetical protein